MQYLNLKVKPRWQEIEQENQLQNQKMWTWFVASPAVWLRWGCC